MGAGDFAESTMTAIGIITRDRSRMLAQAAPSRSIVRQALLVCGLLSSLLYIATDILGGLGYDGYSFTAQAISELAAIGAPSKPFVDPLFIVYDFLALLFGIGILREATGRNRALFITSATLIGYGAIGVAVVALAGPDLFSMHQRGAGSLVTDAPHIALTGVLAVLLLLAMAFGAFALDKRFRIYSLASLVTLIVFGALTSTFVGRLAAGEPTPGMGIVERIDVYSALLWIAVLSIALLRRPLSEPQQSVP
jgi:hypothetical membrane protein